jgi:hypothetical protein
MEEYRAAFATATGRPLPPAHAAAAAAAGGAGKGAGGKPGGAKPAGKGGAGASPRKAGGGGGGGGGAAHHDHDDGAAGAGGDDEGVCQFCGGCGPGASERELDLHYWQSCPMLMSCPRCGQVIEIATLHEHALGECDARAGFEACPTCGDAIPAADLEAHLSSRSCRPAVDPSVGSRCPLCRADIGPGRDGWVAHLLDARCPANPRTNGKGGAGAPAPASPAGAA